MPKVKFHSCPTCAGQARTADVYHAKDGAIYRRRECTNGHRWRTIEVPVAQTWLLTTFRQISARLASNRRSETSS